MSKPIVLCACGCGKVVRRPTENRYASQACVPLSVRLEGIQKGRARYIYRCRATLFRDVVQRLGTSSTREDLVAMLMEVYLRGYNRGHRAASSLRASRGKPQAAA
jgi:hypothetical protein